MFRSGQFVADHVSPISEEQVQPNGVDLTVGAIFEQRDAGHIGRSGKEIGDRQEVEVEEIGETVPNTYYLHRGAYIVRYAETVEIPDDHVGFLYPRSSLMRNSGMLNTAVWDAGYEGKGEGLLQAHQDIAIEHGARVAQLVLARAGHSGTYDGDYQGENLE